MARSIKKLLILIIVFGCAKNETRQEKAEASVKQYISQNANEASSYKSLRFGRLESVYTLDTIAYDELDFTRRKVVTQYNTANANNIEKTADSLKAELVKINDLMEKTKSVNGLKIYHVFEGRNTLGEIVLNRGSFYLDSNFVVKEFVMTSDSVESEKNKQLGF